MNIIMQLIKILTISKTQQFLKNCIELKKSYRIFNFTNLRKKDLKENLQYSI